MLVGTLREVDPQAEHFPQKENVKDSELEIKDFPSQTARNNI